MKKIMILGAGIYQVPLIRTARRMGLYTIVVSAALCDGTAGVGYEGARIPAIIRGLHLQIKFMN